MKIINIDEVKPRIERYIAENKDCGDLFLSGCGDGAYHVLGMIEEATEIKTDNNLAAIRSEIYEEFITSDKDAESTLDDTAAGMATAFRTALNIIDKYFVQ